MRMKAMMDYNTKEEYAKGLMENIKQKYSKLWTEKIQ